MTDSRRRILVADDERINLTVLVELLRGEYRISVAKNGAQALERALCEPHPDLILLDIIMPGMDGYQVCERLKADERTRDIPIIFVTAMGDEHDEARGLELGAVDYITKPLSPSIVKARIRTHLTVREARDFLKHQNRILEHKVQERTRELALTQDVTILCMASLAETRDYETGNHIRRTQHYVRALAERVRRWPQFRSALTDETIDLIYKSAPLHDIGKVGVPDSILLKPGRLTQEENEIMKMHTIYGRDAIAQAESQLGSTSFLRYAREITYTHHERWDGAGYPRGLKGEEIPVSGRLMAIADVYDALISARVYKPAYSQDDAREAMRQGRGSHFDPVMIDAFETVVEVFEAVTRQFADGDDAIRSEPGERR